MEKSTKEEFIQKAKKIHGNEYDYSQVNYINSATKIDIICKKHGLFRQTPNHHLQGRRCPICSKKEKRDKEKNSFIERSRVIHKNKYDYSYVDYINNHEKINIICPIHGNFTQSPKMHLFGNGCPKCGQLHKAKTKINKYKDDFLPRARKVHGDKYDYSKVEYKGRRESVCIICPKHGEFWQTPDIHLHGGNCQKCKQSQLEIEVEKFLKDKKLEYVYQKHFSWLGLQSLDFYLPKFRTAIECQGEQHYRPIDFFGGESRFLLQKRRDNVKENKCKQNNVRLLYYSKSDLADKTTFTELTDLLKEIQSNG